MPLSVVINTKNVANTLDTCLDSVSFADEIVVVDMHSVDKTKEIALKHKAKFFTHDDVGYVEPARNFAISKASHSLILVLDADEIISPGLTSAIKKILKQTNPADVYLIPRKNMIFGEWMKHTGWWPDYQPRLFLRGKVEWSDTIHQPPTMKGKVVKLPAKEELSLIHHHYSSVHSYLERLNRYTSIQADNSFRGFDQPIQAQHLIQTFFNEFFRRFFVFSGYRDDAAGVGLSLMQSCYELAVELKKWEKQSKDTKIKSTEIQIVTSLEKSRSDLSYWLADWRVKNSSGFSKIVWQIRRKIRV